MKRAFLLFMVSLALVFVLPVQASGDQPLAGCAVSELTDERPPEDFIASWSRQWFRSADGQLWADSGRRYADGVKVGWRKPPGTALEVSGRRLDGDAPPLEAWIPEGYPGAFQSSGLYFPTGGCWEITARAGDSTLTFVNFVYPKAFAPPGTAVAVQCNNLRQVARSSALIFVGQAEGDYPVAGGDFSWQTVRVETPIRGTIQAGERLEVLRDVRYDTPLEYGQTYLLFLWSRPGYHLQALCPLVMVDDTQLIVADEFVADGWSAFATGQSLEEAIERIKESLSQGTG
ncbi:MAG: hypothetical protein DWB42_03255 [Chloroflexi bacterium]|nr:hypothetical protein [Chloroflexota bacterium]MDL1882883.1 hypothetical protein [Anaerolineae bacterium CFX8]